MVARTADAETAAGAFVEEAAERPAWGIAAGEPAAVAAAAAAVDSWNSAEHMIIVAAAQRSQMMQVSAFASHNSAAIG